MQEAAKVEVAQEEFMQELPEPTPEQMKQWSELLHKASRGYVKNMIKSVEYKKTKAQRRNKAKLQKASRRQNRK